METANPVGVWTEETRSHQIASKRPVVKCPEVGGLARAAASFPESKTQKQIQWLILSDSDKWFFPRIQDSSEKDSRTKEALISL